MPLKYLCNFWRTLETWSVNCVIASHTPANQATLSAITDTKLYARVVTLSTNNYAKLLQPLKPGFKRTINWNKYQSKVTIETRNQVLRD